MPRRSLSQSSFFAPEFVTPDCLEPGTTPWLLAKYRFMLYPSWLFAGWKGEGRRGRKAWPAVTLMTLLVLRWSEEGMSRLGSTKRARWDVQWRAAMGLNCDIQVPDEKTLREFEDADLAVEYPRCGAGSNTHAGRRPGKLTLETLRVRALRTSVVARAGAPKRRAPPRPPPRPPWSR